MLVMLGGSLTAVTVTSNCVVVVSAPSVTLNVMVVTPLASATGVTVTVRLIPLGLITTFALGTRAVFSEVPLTLSVEMSLSDRKSVVQGKRVVLSSALV